MPWNIMVGIVALLVALVLYTIGTWAMFRAKTVRRGHVVMLWVGVVFDVLATGMMAIQIGGLGRDLHTALAVLAWAGMTAAAALGSWGLATGNERVCRFVARWTVAPWALWALVFVYGMVERGARRMGG